MTRPDRRPGSPVRPRAKPMSGLVVGLCVPASVALPVFGSALFALASFRYSEPAEPVVGALWAGITVLLLPVVAGALHRPDAIVITSGPLSQPLPGWSGLGGTAGGVGAATADRPGRHALLLVGTGVGHARGDGPGSLRPRLGRRYIYKEPFFNGIHQPDPDVVAGIRKRFVATDLSRRLPTGGAPSSTATLPARAGRQRRPHGRVRPVRPATRFVSRHPDQDDPKPTHVARPRTGPARRPTTEGRKSVARSGSRAAQKCFRQP